MDSSDSTQRNIDHGKVILSPRVVALALDQIMDPFTLLARHLSERWLSVKGQCTSIYEIGPAATLVFVITDIVSKRTALLCGDEDEDELLQGELKLTK
jgi:hypothetical protein